MFVNSLVTDDKISIFKMIQSSIGGGAFSKQDAGTSDDRAQTRSRAWSELKNNPRIVRVSRTFGGKDRHSKVRTIRGLRDRRIRLSASTAIQLYDLQDKLGFNQPSKVVDWLINAAQHEIDKLPPLEMLQGNLIQFPQSVANSHMMSSTQPYFGHTIRDDNEFLPRDKAYRFVPSPHLATSDIFNSNVVEGTTLLPKSVNDSSDVLMRSKEKEALKELSLEKGNITRGNVENHGFVMENSAISYSPYYHLEPPNGYSSHAQSEVPHGCHPIAIFSSYMAHDVDSKQYSHIQMASSASSNAPSDPLRTSLHVGIPFLQQNCTALKHPQDRYETYTADS